MKYKKKLFISFEGPEASCKSSQIKLLSNYLNKNKIPHIITREPGGTNISEKLRKIIENINNLWNVKDVFLAGRYIDRGSEKSLKSVRQLRPSLN